MTVTDERPPPELDEEPPDEPLDDTAPEPDDREERLRAGAQALGIPVGEARELLDYAEAEEAAWDEARLAHELDSATRSAREAQPPPPLRSITPTGGPYITGPMYDRALTTARRHELEGAGKIMRSHTAAELLGLPRRFEWLARGFASLPTYGMCAGEKKTLKSYVALFAAVAIASGEPIFGHFHVDRPAPVIVYVGEGGRIPYTNRLERVAEALHVNLDGLPLRCSFENPAVQSPKFRDTLRFDLDEEQPGLVIVDPLYAFHGTSADARNLHDEGALLSSISGPCIDANATLQVVNHFKKSGTGTGLDRITMAGGAEWVDSWWLLSHRAPPRVTDGDFTLLLEIGSRQWGGTDWDLDLHLGRFNPDTGQHEGTITWDLHHHREGSGQPHDDRAERILELVADDPLARTKDRVVADIGGNATSVRAAFDALAEAGDLVWEWVANPDKVGRVRKRKLWRVAGANFDTPTGPQTEWTEYD